MLHRKKLRLALGILSGRLKIDQIDLTDLGYDTYRFRAYGTPSENEIKQVAEEVIYNALEEVYDSIAPS